MKRLSIGLPAIALAMVLALSGTAFTSVPVPPTPQPDKTPAPALKPSYQYMYYWFTYPDDQYNDWETLANEEWEWGYIYWGVEIDTNPMGGTLIAEGYMSNNIPHMGYAEAYLYAHFVN